MSSVVGLNSGISQLLQTDYQRLINSAESAEYLPSSFFSKNTFATRRQQMRLPQWVSLKTHGNLGALWEAFREGSHLETIKPRNPNIEAPWTDYIYKSLNNGSDSSVQGDSHSVGTFKIWFGRLKC